MKLSSPRFRCVIACVMFCTLFSAKLFGCMRSLASFKVPPSFRVTVWNDTKSVPGIAIAVYEDGPSVEGVKSIPVLTLQTDRNGSAEVKNLAPGVYVITIAGPGQGSAEVAAGSTGSNGMVELPHELNGKVTLVVTRAGSPVFTLPLDLIAPTDPAPYLFVTMGVQGYGGDQCSAEHLEKNATP